jgi:hypothetical protein
MPREVPTYAEYRANLQKQLAASGRKLDEPQMHDSYLRTLARDSLVLAQEQLEVSKRIEKWSRTTASILLITVILGLVGTLLSIFDR